MFEAEVVITGEVSLLVAMGGAGLARIVRLRFGLKGSSTWNLHAAPGLVVGPASISERSLFRC